MSHSTLKSIHKVRDKSELKLGGERKYVTALFSDVRGFTSMSEKMSPEEVVGVLNIYLNLQANIDLLVSRFSSPGITRLFYNNQPTSCQSGSECPRSVHR